MEAPTSIPVTLLYAENHVSGGGDAGELTFELAVRNIAFEKRVEVHFGTPDGTWTSAPARYVRSTHDYEVWAAKASFPLAALEGDDDPIQFALHLRAAEHDWWDNNHGRNYRLRSSGDHMLGPELQLHVVNPSPLLPSEAPYAVNIAVLAALHPHKVQVRWTTDGWRTEATATCRQPRRHIGGGERSAALWQATLPVGCALALEYVVRCEAAHGAVRWDNNSGENYKARRDRLRVLTLNLHCFEEDNWDAKFSQIARAIDDHHVDIVCLQEVAEPWNGGRGEPLANAAHMIRDRLKEPYHLAADWSHMGFGEYREGSAVLSRHPIVLKDSGYVSESHDPKDIHARKVVMAQLTVPCLGPVNVFSTHLSWWSDGFQTQFENLRRWANEKHTPDVAATLLCGDFNTEPDSDGYRLATTGGEYEDQFLKAHLRAGRNGAIANGTDRRIDYIFLKRGSALEAVDSKVLFTPADYGPVSDHPGYFAAFDLVG